MRPRAQAKTWAQLTALSFTPSVELLCKSCELHFHSTRKHSFSPSPRLPSLPTLTPATAFLLVPRFPPASTVHPPKAARGILPNGKTDYVPTVSKAPQQLPSHSEQSPRPRAPPVPSPGPFPATLPSLIHSCPSGPRAVPIPPQYCLFLKCSSPEC